MKYVTDRVTDEPSTNERSGSAVILETLLRSLPLGVIVEGADREIIAVNPALCDVLGANAEPSAFVGRDCARVAERQKDLFADSDGTGQGLRIVERIVDAHGWEVDLGESNRGGARFEITGVEFVD